MKFQPADNHWQAGEQYRERVTKKQLQELLLNEPNIVFKYGRSHSWKHKHIGAGIYEIWLEMNKT